MQYTDIDDKCRQQISSSSSLEEHFLISNNILPGGLIDKDDTLSISSKLYNILTETYDKSAITTISNASICTPTITKSTATTSGNDIDGFNCPLTNINNRFRTGKKITAKVANFY